ncbi:MBL fold metallo-hydrolase [Amylibacter sp. SFDW26]|uniref:MBL fold metallo-hydrolase n=1 Tax=Amylibacter sp. SFDW26 TaxID=2652722 RepID=UPI00126255B5|nr:MBL fold metallo-hydrolase [Amylibacter sp. SFDW26]KAB7616036.1 MBL fold metallo-hydrolase [Amylibacter sp. SFDW26]
MSITVTLNRRHLLAGAASLPITTSLAAHAAAPLLGSSEQIFSRFKMGDFEITTLLVAQSTRKEPQGTFGMNVSPEEFAKASAENFIPYDQTETYFTPTLVNTGKELILFDTGLGGETLGVLRALRAAGYSEDQVDIVVLTHMHPDHIGGLMVEGSATFPNARYITGTTEYEFWLAKGPEHRIGGMVANLVKPLAEKTTFIDPNYSVASGITALDTSGHTPGHMGYMLESGGRQVFIAADMANHHVWSLAYPDWEVRFDTDKVAAAATRRRVLGMLATDKIPMIGYHLPFPALGYVSTRGEGFHYTPASYQFSG